jgi:putative membrane protein
MKNFKKSAFVTGIVLFFVTFLTLAFVEKAPKLSDAEIASVAVVANQNDIDFANIAVKKSKNVEVINFAKTMIADHQSVINMAVALVTKLKVTPKDNAVSKEYVANAKATMKMLNSKSTKTFDKAYVDNEVAYHKAVIAAVKTVLIPEAQNAELKALLQKVVPILETHLHHAEMVQSKMK